MLALSIRGMAARKLRVVLTGFAVVLGVAMVSGTFLLTDTITRSFDEIFTTTNKNVDVAVLPRQALDKNTDAPPFSASVLKQVKAVDGVAFAQGGIFGSVSIRDKKGKKIGAFAPNFAGSAQQGPFNVYHYVSGHAPTNASEAALDKFTADKHHFKVGDSVTVAGRGPAKAYHVVGVAKFGTVSSLGGASIAIMTLPEAQRVLGAPGKFTEIDVRAAPGVNGQVLKRRIEQVVPRSLEVRTGTENAAQESKDLNDSFSFLSTALLAFGGIALFVGAFIIFNTFSITVQQRTRELALLRMLGATRRQIMGSVLLESLVIGIGASLAGLAAGFVLAPGLRGIFSAIGADLPGGATVVKPRTIIAALLVGILTTLLASIPPARRATRVAPVAALREGVELEEGRRSRVRGPASILLCVGGFGLLLLGLFGNASGGSVAALLGGGAVAVFIGVALLSPRLVPPLVSGLGRPLVKWAGLPGRLATENAKRNPGRTAVTSAALMIGLALVTFATIFTAGAKSSINGAIDRGFAGDLALQASGGGNGAFPPEAADAVAKVEGVRTATGITFGKAKIRGKSGSSTLSAVDPQKFGDVYKIQWRDGSPATLRKLGPRDTIVESKWAGDNGVHVGDTVALKTQAGAYVPFHVTGSLRDKGGLIGTGLVVSQATGARTFGFTHLDLGFVKVQAGANVNVVRARIDQTLKRSFPEVETQSQQELKDDIAGQLDQTLALIYVLLSLSIIVSLFGIVNTLVLSITERTRELGMLRAIGTSRRQVRRMVRYESVITALIGGVLGSVLGIVFAEVIAQALRDDGFELAFPVAQLLLLLFLAGFAGVLAAIPPARRAARLNPLEALNYE